MISSAYSKLVSCIDYIVLDKEILEPDLAREENESSSEKEELVESMFHIF